LLQRSMVAPRPRNKLHKTDWVCGASMIIRREVFDSIGLLDEKFFLYYEETDFCRRAHKAGWSCWVVPPNRVVHLEWRSTGATGIEQQRRRLPKYWFDSRRRYYRKHHGAGYEFMANAVHAGGFALWRVRKFLQRRKDQDTPYYLWDMIRNTFRGL